LELNKNSVYVKSDGNNWGIELKDSQGNNINGFIKMQSKEDAVRYAHVCEQRTGCNVSLPSK